MYLSYFHLREAPFSIAPDPAFLYLSPRHQEALGHLLYGTGRYGGFVQLTGEVGTGKTTLVRTLLHQKLEGVEVAMIHNPRLSEGEFVATLCDEFRVDYPHPPIPSLKVMVDALNAHLLQAHAQGKRSVLIIDEAQNLAPEVLEQVRLLTNLETDKEKLLHIMLIGQPELAELLGRQELRQLASRITARYHLLPLNETETREYIAHRLRVAGGAGNLFSPKALRAIQRRSRGVPRLINVLCDRALLGAYAQNLPQVTPQVVHQAASEVLGTPAPIAWRTRVQKWGQRIPLVGVEAVLACAALIVAGVLLGRVLTSSRSAPVAPVVAASIAPPVTTDNPVPKALAAARAPAAPTPARVTNASTPPVPGGTHTNLGRLLAHPEALGALVGRLIALWSPGLTIPANANVCTELAKHDLQCYRATTQWDELVQMNRPAILELAAGTQPAQYVLLTRLAHGVATLDTGHGPVHLPAAQLRTAWTGEFLVLWRGATDTNFVRPTAQGAPVIWLRQQLARVDGNPLPSAPSPVFDAALTAQIKDYQRAAGLDADGLAGVMTLISLSTAGHADDTPMLHANTDGG
ncbi:MAG TPA: AAA family ATPase [Nevskiaceae bacterium]|nr:AAA family ATPase [Nevskiaceae bacterium]